MTGLVDGEQAVVAFQFLVNMFEVFSHRAGADPSESRDLLGTQSIPDEGEDTSKRPTRKSVFRGLPVECHCEQDQHSKIGWLTTLKAKGVMRGELADQSGWNPPGVPHRGR